MYQYVCPCWTLLPGHDRFAVGVQETAILFFGTAICGPAGRQLRHLQLLQQLLRGLRRLRVARSLVVVEREQTRSSPSPGPARDASRSHSEFFSEMPAPSTTERETPGVSASCSGRKYSVPVEPTRSVTRFGILLARQVDRDPVGAVLLDGRLRRTEGVQALVIDRHRLAHDVGRDLDARVGLRLQHDLRAAAQVEPEHRLAGGEQGHGPGEQGHDEPDDDDSFRGCACWWVIGRSARFR